MSIQRSVIACFTTKELENALKLAKASDMRFFHLRGHGGKLCFCDTSIDGSRLLTLVFRGKETQLGWRDVKGVIEAEYGYRSLRRYMKESILNPNTAVVYSEFDDGGISFGCLSMPYEEGGLESEIYRESGSYRYSYTADHIESKLKNMPNISLDLLQKHQRAVFRIGLKRFLNVLKGLKDNIVLFTADGDVFIQGVTHSYADDIFTMGEKMPLGVRSDKKFANMTYLKESLLKYANALHQLAPQAVATVSVSDAESLTIEADAPNLEKITYVQGVYILPGIKSSFDGVEIER